MTREEAAKELQVYAENSWGGLNEAFELAIKALQMPEIVYCKYCKYRGTSDCAMHYDCANGEQHSWETDTDYCSWGD